MIKSKLYKIIILLGFILIFVAMLILGGFSFKNKNKIYVIGGTYAYNYEDSGEYIIQRGSVTRELSNILQLSNCQTYNVVNVMEENVSLNDMFTKKEYASFIKKVQKDDIVIAFLDRSYNVDFQKYQECLNDSFMMPLSKCNNVLLIQPYHIDVADVDKYVQCDEEIEKIATSKGIKFVKDEAHIDKIHMEKLDFKFLYPLMAKKDNDYEGYDYNSYNELGARKKSLQILSELSKDNILAVDLNDWKCDNLNSVTRGEFLNSIINCANIGLESGVAFKDVNMKHKYADAIYTAKKLRFISGYNDCFRPDDYITTEEAAVIAVKVLEYKNYNFENHKTEKKNVFGNDELMKEICTEQISDFAVDDVWKLYLEDICIDSYGKVDAMTIYTIYDIYDLVYDNR